MSTVKSYLPFSQRSGLAPIPPQLKLGEVSSELRRLLDYCIRREIERVARYGYAESYFDGHWKDVSTDLHVKFFRKSVSSYENNPSGVGRNLAVFVGKASIANLFDLVEFLVRHPGCTVALKSELADAFVSAHAAYRIVDAQILAIGIEEQAAAFEAAIVASEVMGARAARQHLVTSGAELRNGNWANSVRESIHAVESIARRIAPESTTLGPALKALEKQGYIHGSLSAAFGKLYGYTNDENGIRHALSDIKAQVDEVDALFMLGACASFVSYLLAKETAFSQKGRD